MGSSKLRHRGHVWPITLVYAIRHVKRRAAAQLTQPIQEQRCRGSAIDVVVCKDGDTLSARNRTQHARCRGVHVFQTAGIRQEITQFWCKIVGCLVRRDTQSSKHRAQRPWQSTRLCKSFGLTLHLDARTDPATPSHAVFHPEISQLATSVLPVPSRPLDNAQAHANGNRWLAP